MLLAVRFWKTASLSTSQNMASLAIMSSDMGCSLRHTRISGVMPMLRNSLTLCWVGFVFSSPAAPI